MIVHVTLCYLSHKRVRPKLYLQNKGALQTCVFCFHTSQQRHKFRGCSQKLNMCDLYNIADPPRTMQGESQPCFHINTHRRRKLRSLRALRSAMETNLLSLLSNARFRLALFLFYYLEMSTQFTGIVCYSPPGKKPLSLINVKRNKTTSCKYTVKSSECSEVRLQQRGSHGRG